MTLSLKDVCGKAIRNEAGKYLCRLGRVHLIHFLNDGHELVLDSRSDLARAADVKLGDPSTLDHPGFANLLTFPPALKAATTSSRSCQTRLRWVRLGRKVQSALHLLLDILASF